MKMGHQSRIEIADEDTRRLIFRDDDRDGFAFQVFHAPDGDFHIGITVIHEDADDFDQEHYGAVWAKSIRVRMPMIGGGSHPELYDALAQLFKAIPRATSGAKP
jgi:hypothetical protein